jgi:hypothetical protein
MSSDWNEEFTKLVQQGIGDPGAATVPETGQDTAAPAEQPAKLLPMAAEVELCLTCHEFSCSGSYEFGHTTGTFFDVATRQMSGRYVEPRLVKGPRRDLVVCTQDALCSTQSQARGEREDNVTLYSVPFSDVLGASVRHRHEGVVEVYIDEGPTLCFEVEPDVADALQSQVDQAAQSQ